MLSQTDILTNNTRVARVSMRYSNQYLIGCWLVICAAAVYLMVIVGGITRLTQSGLSMVEWAPIMGVLPPLSHADWIATFAKYQQYPEYQKINFGMNLAEFKSIYWWEYGHRILGRVIGLLYLLPLLYFWLKRMIPSGWHGKLFVLLCLGGLQGLMGWYMVKSGLVDQPHVSQYRLTAHLSLALVIFTLMWWFALSFLQLRLTSVRSSRLFRVFAGVTLFVVGLMIVSGGFVAGTKAGHIYNTFPKMGEHWVPAGLLAMSPWWQNVFENAVSIQFLHRCIAVLVVCSVAATLWIGRRGEWRMGMQYLVPVMLLQITLGISALLYKVPVSLGSMHQAGAVALLAATVLLVQQAWSSRVS